MSNEVNGYNPYSIYPNLATFHKETEKNFNEEKILLERRKIMDELINKPIKNNFGFLNEEKILSERKKMIDGVKYEPIKKEIHING